MKIKLNFNGPLRKNQVNPRYFTDETGKSIYLTGSHTWAVMQDIWLEGETRKSMDYESFIQMMEDNGHNFLRFWQWFHPKNASWSKIPILFSPQPFERTGPGNANDGLPKFNLTKCNEDYFKRLRYRVTLAAEKGIFVSIMMFDGWGIKCAKSPEDDPWTTYEFNPANNVNGLTDNPIINNSRAWDVFSLNCPEILHWQKEYIKKIIDTVNDMDNILFEICNEPPNRKESMDWMEHLCNFIHEYEKNMSKQHPVGITAEGGGQINSLLFETSADWTSPGNGNLYEYRYNPPAADGSKVIIIDTDHLWGRGCEIAWIWKCFTRGMNTIFMDPWEPVPGKLDQCLDGNISNNQRYYYAWDPVRRNMGYTRHYAARMNLNNCEPHNELCTSTYCLADPGKEYLCFLPEGGTSGLDMRNAKDEFITEWINPYTGEIFNGTKLAGGKRELIIAPFEGPSVFYAFKP